MNKNQNCHPDARAVETRNLSPRCEITETAEAVQLSAELPGVAEKSIEVSVERNVLTIAGRIEEADTNGWKRVHGGLSQGTFRRSFQLSSDVDTSDIRAHAANGVLTLSLPKRAPKRVTVNVS